jgi:hypothetical protein
MFDIVIFQWINFILLAAGIVYTHIVVRKLNSFYIGVPLLLWLFQAFLFFLFYFLNYYTVITIVPKFFMNWSTMSFTLGLVIMFIYLYYMQHSCWRGNGKL